MNNCYFSNIRKKLCYSQARIAGELGLTVRQVSRLENGYPLSLQTRLALECLLRREGLFGEQQHIINFE